MDEYNFLVISQHYRYYKNTIQLSTFMGFFLCFFFSMKRKADEEVSSTTCNQVLVSLEELEADLIPLDNFVDEELNRLFEESDTHFTNAQQAAAQLGPSQSSSSFGQQSPLPTGGEQSATPPQGYVEACDMFEDDFEQSETLFANSQQAAAQLGPSQSSSSFGQHSPLQSLSEQSPTPAQASENFPSLTAGQQTTRCSRNNSSIMFSSYDLETASDLEQPPPPPVRHQSPPPPNQMLNGPERM